VAQERLLLRQVLRPERVLSFLRPGRLVRVREGPLEWGWGVVLAVHKLELAVVKVCATPLCCTGWRCRPNAGHSGSCAI
jgi:hypothetical protein